MYSIRFPESISCDSQINISKGHFSYREKNEPQFYIQTTFYPIPNWRCQFYFSGKRSWFSDWFFWVILRLLKVKHGNSATLLQMNLIPNVSLGFSDIWPTFLDIQCKTDCWKNKGNGGNLVVFYFNSFNFPFSMETVLWEGILICS